MLNVLNLKCLLRANSISIVQLAKVNYSADKSNKRNRENTPKDEVIEPLQLSYNSYEDLSSDPTTPPVLIMHGLCVNTHIYYPFKPLTDWPIFFHLGLFGSKQNWRSISKAIHSKTKPTRKVNDINNQRQIKTVT